MYRSWGFKSASCDAPICTNTAWAQCKPHLERTVGLRNPVHVCLWGRGLLWITYTMRLLEHVLKSSWSFLCGAAELHFKSWCPVCQQVWRHVALIHRSFLGPPWTLEALRVSRHNLARNDSRWILPSFGQMRAWRMQTKQFLLRGKKGMLSSCRVVIKRIYNIRKLFCMTRVLVLGKTRLKPKFWGLQRRTQSLNGNSSQSFHVRKMDRMASQIDAVTCRPVTACPCCAAEFMQKFLLRHQFVVGRDSHLALAFAPEQKLGPSSCDLGLVWMDPSAVFPSKMSNTPPLYPELNSTTSWYILNTSSFWMLRVFMQVPHAQNHKCRKNVNMTLGYIRFVAWRNTNLWIQNATNIWASIWWIWWCFFLFNLAHTHTAIAGTGFGVRKLHERVLNVA